MTKRRREGESPEQKEMPAQDEHGFGLFYVESPKDVRRVRKYLENPTNAVLVVLAPGVRKKTLALLPRPSKKRIIRVVRRDEAAGLIESEEFLPHHWRHQQKKETK